MKHLAAFLLVALPIVCVCQSTEPVELTIPIPADHIVLQTGKAIVTSAGITVWADTVIVSICPRIANCFLPDKLSASLRLVRDQESQSVRLVAFPGTWSEGNTTRSDSVSIRLGGQLYRVILKAPYTNETDRSTAGKAILQVTPL